MFDADLITDSADDCFDENRLRRENRYYRKTPGVSDACRGHGFAPAFRDSDTGEVFLSRYADGRPAPFHTLEGLPDSVVTRRAADGSVESVNSGLESGFVRAGVFFTREQAIHVLSENSGT